MTSLCLARALLVLITAVVEFLEVGSSVDDVTISYRYLDNNIYTVPAPSRADAQNTFDREFDKRFPPPPLFPPPPPKIKNDTNALLRNAIFANMGTRMKGDNSDGYQGQSAGAGSGSANHKGPIIDAEKMCAVILDNQGKLPMGPKPENIGQQNEGSAKERGPPGRHGKRGRRGKRGPPGHTGPEGPVGPVGPQGIQGPPGKEGLQGLAGPRGFPGQRGLTGLPGFPGPAGPAGARGVDGIPGLVIFSNADAMYGVSLEGLLAYRSDVKQLYFRDHQTWRSIVVTRCGDGMVDRESHEECDDGNDDMHDHCARCRKAYCGDGIRRRTHEDCDGTDFGRRGRACAAWKRGTSGTVHCTSKCTISFDRCHYKHRS